MDKTGISGMILDIVASRTPRGWLIIDRSHKIVFVNKAILRTWHKQMDEVLGRQLPDILAAGDLQEGADDYLRPLVDTIDSGQEVREREVNFYDPDTRAYRWFLANTYIFKGRSGQLACIAVDYTPIDKLKAIETKLGTVNLELVKSFAKAIGARDRHCLRHVETVSALMVGLAEYLRFPAEDTALAYLVGLTHDIGKIAVPEAILNKPERLTDAEYDTIKRHPAAGAGILGELAGFANIAAIVYHHHERWDGSGYPNGLARDAIPLLSRMLAVCEAYDTMVSARSYRTPRTVKQALEEINRCAGSQFDPVITGHFVEFIKRNKSAPFTLEPVGDCG